MPDENHLSARVLRDYRQGGLAPLAMLDASDHVAACAACREALAQTDGGPAYEELAAAVDGVLGPTARADLTARLADAPAASAELLALQRFKEEMAPRSGRVYGPSSLPADDRSEATRIVVPPAAVWRTPRFQTIAAAAAVILLVGGWWTFDGLKRSTEIAALLTDRSGHRVDPATLPADLREDLERTLRTGHLDPRTESSLRPPPGRLAGPTSPGPIDFRVLSPVGVCVREVYPALRWTTRPDAAAYVVTLAGLDGTDARNSPELPPTQTTWTPPEPLVPGTIYVWQVEALRAGETLAKTPAPPAPEARFQVLSDSQRAELEQVESISGGSPLILALAYRRAGLETDAAGQWSKLVSDHPDSALARRLSQEARAAQSPSPINTKGAQ